MAEEVGARLEKQIPFLDQSAVGVMKNKGLTVLEIRDSEHSEEWMAEARAFADQMRGEMVPVYGAILPTALLNSQRPSRQRPQRRQRS